MRKLLVKQFNFQDIENVTMCIYNLTVAGFLSLLLSVCVVRLLIINKFFVFCFFFPVQNIDTDMLAISFLLVASEDLCHEIHIFQAQNGGFCDPIILLSHVVKIFHSMQSVCGHYSILV